MSDPQVLLAIEASQRRGGVAVRDSDGRDHEELLGAEAMHDDDLLAAIDRLYIRLSLVPSDTRAIGVSTGPGGFTGLRIAVATAKMLAESLGASLVAVPTSLVVAESFQEQGPIIVALSSRQQTVWATRLEQVGSERTWAMMDEGGLADADAIRLDGIAALLGDRYLPEVLRARCREAGVAVVEPVFSPLACLAVAGRLLAEGRTTDSLELAPEYSRPPAAVVKSNRDRYRR